MSIDQRINEVIQIKKYSNEYIGKQIKVSKNTISNFRKGVTEPSIKFITYLVKEHPGLSLNWLILGKGEMWESVGDGSVMGNEKLEKEVAGLKEKLKDYDEVKAIVKEIQGHFKIVMDEMGKGK